MEKDRSSFPSGELLFKDISADESAETLRLFRNDAGKKVL